jgi:Tfp pilus assembly protein PilO
MPSQREQIQSTLVKFYQQPIAKVSLELFLSIGAVLFFAIFAIRPTLLTMSDLIKEIEDKRELSQQLDQKIAALSSAQTEYSQVQNRLQVLDQAIPSAPQFEQALKIIERVASDNQLVISRMQVREIPQEPAEDIPFEDKERVSLPISVTVVGDYPSIRQFVEDIINTRRAMVIDSIVFSVSDQREQQKLSATITINLQYFGDPDESVNNEENQ